MNMKLGRRKCVQSSDSLFSYFNDMIERFCPGFALSCVYNDFFLVWSSKIIFPIRASFSCFCH